MLLLNFIYYFIAYSFLLNNLKIVYCYYFISRFINSNEICDLVYDLL